MKWTCKTSIGSDTRSDKSVSKRSRSECGFKGSSTAACGFAAGAGKTSALNFLAANAAGAHATVLSLADYHPNALPQTVNPELILLDDVTPAHADYLARLAQQYPQAHIFVAARAAAGLPPEFARLTLEQTGERPSPFPRPERSRTRGLPW